MISGNTSVLIQGQGLVKAKHSENVCEVWNGTDYSLATHTKNSAPSVVVFFKGAKEIECSADHQFKVLYKNEVCWLNASDLRRGVTVLRTKATPEFDFLPTYKNLSSFELGNLLAISMLFQTDKKTFKIPAHEFEIRKILKDILKKLGDEAITYEQFLSTKIYMFYELGSLTIDDLNYVKSLFGANGFSESTLRSKPFFKGFMQIFFNFAEQYTNEIRIPINKQGALHLQEILHFFGIKTHVNQESNPVTIKIQGLDLFKFITKISLVDPQKFLKSIPLEKIETYKRMQYKPLTLRVANVIVGNECEEMYDFEGVEYTANGIITKDSGDK